MADGDPVPEEQVAREFDRLRGRLLGMVESWGLPNIFGDDGVRQEHGMKALLKTLTYESQKRITESIEDLQ